MPDKIITTEQLQRIEHLFGQITRTLLALRQAETTPLPPPQPLGEPIARYLDAVRRGLSDHEARGEYEAAVAEADDAPTAERCQHDKRGKCECPRCPGCGYAVGSQACEESPDHAAPGHQPIKLTGADPASGAPLTDMFDQAAAYEDALRQRPGHRYHAHQTTDISPCPECADDRAVAQAATISPTRATLEDYRRTVRTVLEILRPNVTSIMATSAATDLLEALDRRQYDAPR